MSLVVLSCGFVIDHIVHNLDKTAFCCLSPLSFHAGNKNLIKLRKTPEGFTFTCMQYIIRTYFLSMFCLFQDIEAKQKAASDMQRVIDEPAMGQSDLDQLNHQV